MKNWYKTWQEVEGHWQKMLPYFRPLILRSFISWFAIAPVIVRLFEGLPKNINIAFGSEIYQLNLSLPFSWQILWFASLSYFIAYALFSYGCPRFIRTFPTFSEFSLQQHSPRFLTWELYRVWRDYKDNAKTSKRLIDKKLAVEVPQIHIGENPRVEESGTIFGFESGNRAFEVCISENTNLECQRELFWEIFGRHADNGTKTRNMAWFFIILSSLLVLAVVVQQIVSVLLYLIGW